MLQLTLTAGFIAPCLPSPADPLPSGPGWIHEIKLDGFRMMVRRDPAGVRPPALPAPGRAGVFLFAFDLLEPNGQDMRREPLERRKRGLAVVLRSKAGTGIQFNEHCDDLPADIVFRHACKLGFEGIVSKRLGSPYRSGRSRDWLKMKNPSAPAVKRARRRRTGAGKIAVMEAAVTERAAK